jgi:hypothetical protein
MKTGKFALACAALFAAGTLVPFASAQESASASRSGPSSASLAGGTPIYAELNSSIDSKKAKPGDAVMAHTTQAVKSSDERTILPKGTKLMGHVTQASARSKGDGESALGISFDKAILKGGEEVPLNATIQALAPPRASTMPEMSPGPSGPSTAQTAGNTGNLGTSGSRAPGSTSSPSGNYPSPGYGGTNPSGGGEGNSGELPPNSRGVYGLNGVQLKVSASNNSQVSLISSDGKNVHLDSGTRLLLMTQTLASETSGQQ